MVLDYIKQLNWIDIIVVILLIRIVYIAVKTGFTIEVFKLLGTVCAIYLACHYYLRVGIFLNSYFSLKGVGWGNFLNFIVFFALAYLGYLAFVIIRLVCTILIKMEAVSLLNRWGALILGIVRWGLFSSLLLFLVVISHNGYLKNSLSNSLASTLFVKLTPKVYQTVWTGLISRFANEEAFNKAVFAVGSNLSE